MATSVHIAKKEAIEGTIIVPGDKSISHRAVILSALSTGKSTFENMLLGADCLSTVSAFRMMGVPIQIQEHVMTVEGCGLCGLSTPKNALDIGNSGTTIRLLSGILSAQKFESTLFGDASLNSRPMGRIIDPLRLMGARIDGTGDKATAPLSIRGGVLQGIFFEETKGSAQVKSSVLLAGMYAKGETTVVEVKPSRDHTERMLQLFNAPFEKKDKHLTIQECESLTPVQQMIPNDISSAAFFIVAALILDDSEIVLPNVGLNPTRMGIIKVLQSMGADIEVVITADDYEPIGTITARSSNLTGIDIDPDLIPFIIDELPILMIAASCASGTTTITGAQELRVKETDRIASMARGLTLLNIPITETEDGVIIDGVTNLEGGVTIDSCHDHRTAMSFAILALKTEKGIDVVNPSCVEISYPNFFQTLEQYAH